MKQLRFICAQPAIKYYAWQVEVLLNNFIKREVNLNHVDILCSIYNNVIPIEWSKLANAYAARFFFYNDTRKTRYYISSLRPNVLKQHWLAHPYLKDYAIFYHDCDILFTKPVSKWITKQMLSNNEWYGSNTCSYIAHSYIKSKGDDIIQKMCEIMELDEKLIKDNELNCIGAQYLMKNLDFEFWDKVESDCEKLFRTINEMGMQKKAADNTYHELQIWCADMWAILWGAWRLGYKTNCHKNFDFSWATSIADEYNKMNIMHNAGAVSPDNGLFYKALYMNEYQYYKDLDILKDTASYFYWQEVCETSKKSCLI